MNERTYINQLDDLEEAYRAEQRQIEEKLEDAFDKKQQFKHELEDLSENYRYHDQQSDFSEPINMSRVYHLLDHYQEEAEFLVHKTMQLLTNKQEDTALQYRQATRKLEMSWLFSRKRKKRMNDKLEMELK